MMPVIAFSISLSTLILFLVFKFFEVNHSIKAYTYIRKKGDNLVISIVAYFHSNFGKIKKYLSVNNIFQICVQHTASSIAKIASRVERKARNVTRKMSRDENAEISATKSKFLKEVSIHKNGLDTERIKRETSLVENNEK